MGERSIWRVRTVSGKRLLATLHGLSSSAAETLTGELARSLNASLELLRHSSPRERNQAAGRGRSRPAAGSRRTRKNPGASLVDEARRTFRTWHGFDARSIVRRRGARAIPPVLVVLGEVPEIIYTSDKWTGKKQTYVHKTSQPRPLLATGPNGRGLFLIGGNVKVTDRGLED